jgi:hypothetical protein
LGTSLCPIWPRVLCRYRVFHCLQQARCLEAACGLSDMLWFIIDLTEVIDDLDTVEKDLSEKITIETAPGFHTW